MAIFECKRHPGLIVWDGQKDDAACQFKGGRLETDDKRAIELVRAVAKNHQITEVKDGRQKRIGDDVEHAEAQAGGEHDAEDERVRNDEQGVAPGEEVKIGDLRRQAKALGINSFGLNKEAIIKAIAEKPVA